MNIYSLDLIVFVVVSIIAIISAIMVIRIKSLVYAAFSLGILGLSIAILFALMGFGFVSLFQVMVYVGATVTFIIFSVIMFRESLVMEAPGKIMSISAGILAAYIFICVFYIADISADAVVYVPYSKVAELLITDYNFPLIVAIFALVTTLVEGIIIARKEVEK